MEGREGVSGSTNRGYLGATYTQSKELCRHRGLSIDVGSLSERGHSLLTWTSSTPTPGDGWSPEEWTETRTATLGEGGRGRLAAGSNVFRHV